MQSSPVFYDETGRRRRALARLAAALALFLAVCGTVFALSLVVVPYLPRIAGVSAPGIAGADS